MKRFKFTDMTIVSTEGEKKYFKFFITLSKKKEI